MKLSKTFPLRALRCAFVPRAAAAALSILLVLSYSDTFRGTVSGSRFSPMPHTKANSVYANLASGNLTFSVNAANASLISTNDNWSGVASVEGYFGQGLTATHGVDPRTVLGTEFTNNALMQAGSTQVNADKGNPSAFNAGGVTEFDKGTYLAIGFQGNVQANPYLVFYVNTTGQSQVSINFDVQDIDEGSNNAISQLAVQYRVGNSGSFTNLPGGYVADATDGPNIAGRVTRLSLALPAAALNQPQVQVRVITTNAANGSGSSTPDEWVGVNNFVIGTFAPTAGPADVSGRVMTPDGRPVSRALVTMLDQRGATNTAITNSFGYFRFTQVPSGEAYVISVNAKGYTFEPQLLSVNEDLADVYLIAKRPTVIVQAASAEPSVLRNLKQPR